MRLFPGTLLRTRVIERANAVCFEARSSISKGPGRKCRLHATCTHVEVDVCMSVHIVMYEWMDGYMDVCMYVRLNDSLTDWDGLDMTGLTGMEGKGMERKVRK